MMTHNQSIPQELRFKRSIFIKYFSAIEHPLIHTVERLLYVSDYAQRQHVNLLSLLKEDNCLTALTKDDYSHFAQQISLETTAPAFSKAIRQFRHRHFLRLLLRELAHLARTEETMTSWSYCADSLILHTLKYAEQKLMERHGRPCDEQGVPAEFLIIAMGKLGGMELNFSSDIDLIFSYTKAGCTDGIEKITNEQYFTKIAQQLMQLLQTITVDGLVFRVDLRLRPNGDSGPIVYTLDAMETYYQEQGRDWERYAMVKARPLSLSGNNQWFDRLIIPFVYRRYVDFSVIESLRSMKSMIEREIQLNPMLDDIKRGRGGIREVEFTIQCFQLIRGGRLPNIQIQNALAALESLKKEGLLAHTMVLQQAYLFLRKLENTLQMQNDQQIHSLPTDSVKQIQLYVALEFQSWDELLEKLHQYQRIISRAFHAALGRVGGYQDEKRIVKHQLASLWHGQLERKMAITLLSSLGYQEAERCYQMIYDFRHSSRCTRLLQTARLRLDRFMVVLLYELAQEKKTDIVLLQVLSLLENIVGRSAYLALLTENPVALKELLYWFTHSPFITALIVNQPFLLEVLIDQKQTWRPLSKKALERIIKERLSHCSEDEAQDDVLRQFKLMCWLSAARAELYGDCDAVKIGRFLADVAEVIIVQVLLIACQRLKARYPDIMRVKSCFTIIAYGKLGSREMNYDSDVDLVFLHTVAPIDESLVTRLTQKILHMLTTRSQAGILYTVDTRLRPSGSSGLLVSHLDTFKDYQRIQAWTWEHQALLRARVLFGERKVKLVFNQLKNNILFLLRDRNTLLNDVLSMRVKIGKHTVSDAIKHVAGGLLDLEFLVQFLVLAYPAKGFVSRTSTASQLQHLYQNHVLTLKQFAQLKRAYRYYHQCIHQHLLQSVSIASNKYQKEVLAISQTLMC